MTTVILVMVLSTIALGLHLTGALLLSGGLLYSLAVPMTLLFVVCLIKFPWDTKIIMMVCVGGLFVLSFGILKGIREKQRKPSMETRLGAGGL